MLNFTASKGVNVEIWHAYTPSNSTPIPNTANYNGMPVVVVDLSSSGAAGSVPFSGNAVVLHGSSPFTLTYTVNAVAEAGQSSGNNFTQSQPTCGSNTGTNWMDLCIKISFALTSSCDTLVNPDNSLTSQGMHVRNCIEGGAALAGAALLVGPPPTTIVSLLPTVAQLGGCGDVVDWTKLTLGQLKGLGPQLR